MSKIIDFGKKDLFGEISATACFILWGLLPIYWSLFAGINPLVVLSNRIIYSALFLMLWHVFFAPEKFKLSDKRDLFLCFISGALLAVNWGIYVYAVSIHAVLASSLGYFICPLMLIGIGILTLGEERSKDKMFALKFLLLGLVPILMEANVKTVLIAFGLGLSLAFYGVVKRILRISSVSALTIESLLLVPFAFLYLITVQLPERGVAGFFVDLTSGPVTVLPLLLFGMASSRVSFSTLGIIQYISPTLQLVCGLWFFGEKPSSMVLTSFILIWIGILSRIILGAMKPEVDLTNVSRRLLHLIPLITFRRSRPR